MQLFEVQLCLVWWLDAVYFNTVNLWHSWRICGKKDLNLVP